MTAVHSLTDAAVAKALEDLAQRHPSIASALAQVGYPAARSIQPNFAGLLKIIVGQQISVSAAASIWDRLSNALTPNPEPESLLAQDDETLRAAGLSRAKMRYARALADHIQSGQLNPAGLADQDDQTVVSAITAVKGLGPWSAQIFLMFALGRPDIWPAGDLAARAGLGRILGTTRAPDARNSIGLAQPFAPYRSALALLCWKYYSAPPLAAPE